MELRRRLGLVRLGLLGGIDCYVLNLSGAFVWRWVGRFEYLIHRIFFGVELFAWEVDLSAICRRFQMMR